MDILVVGSGGREHAIVMKLAESSQVDKLYATPGNGGISRYAECFDVSATDIDGVVELAKKLKVEIVVVAPDDPLVLGMVDVLNENGIMTFGPNKAAAIIEGSKAFSKDLMKKYEIPTAGYEVFDNSSDAISYIKSQNTYPTVIKADGLALGKGVIIAENEAEAVDGVKTIMEDKIFGESGAKLVVEEFLVGPEISVLTFTDGKTIVPMISSMDHKRALDGDLGLNTGGMGTVAPNPYYTDEIADIAMKTIFIPTIEAMKSEGRTFKGCLYFGLMLTSKGLKVIEYNCRFGDPETQVVLPLLEGDLAEIFKSIYEERLSEVKISWKKECCTCVVMASGGYPKEYAKGIEINGFDELGQVPGAFVYHAGTKFADGKFYTNGGRVLGVTATGLTLSEALLNSYKAVKGINFTDAHYRNDIGKKALEVK